MRGNDYMADMPWGDLVQEAGDRFNPVPPGTYAVTVKSAEAGVSKTKEDGSGGNPMLKCKVVVAEGPHAGKSVTTMPYVYIVKSPAAAGMFLGHMRALGITPDRLIEANPTLEQIAKAITGKQATAEVFIDPKRKQNDGSAVHAVRGTLRAPEGGAIEVTEFPPVSAAESLGYGDAPAGPAPSDDPGF